MTHLFITLSAITISLLAWLLWPSFRNKQFSLCGAIFVTVFAFSAALYFYVGSPRIVPLVSAHQARISAINATIATYSKNIISEPNNLEARLFLGQAYFDLGDYPSSAAQFKEAVLLSKGQPRIIMAYAEAMIMLEKGVVSPASKKSIDIALMIDPKLPLARYYKAVWLLQEGKTENAMAEMKALYAELPDDSSLKKRINAQIGR